MNCSKCDSTRICVKDVVHDTTNKITYRKRRCLDCGKIFYTVETEVPYVDGISSRWNRHHRSNKNRQQ
jgi:transcriptional regulator NrdR family protein